MHLHARRWAAAMHACLQQRSACRVLAKLCCACTHMGLQGNLLRCCRDGDAFVLIPCPSGAVPVPWKTSREVQREQTAAAAAEDSARRGEERRPEALCAVIYFFIVGFG